MIITVEDRKRNKDKQLLFDRLYKVKDNMVTRCTNKKDKNYKSYGGNGVTVCAKWRTIAGFLDDVDKIEGWDLELFLAKKLQLDKDFKIPGNKLYSRETCMWISPSKNRLLQPNRTKPFYAYNIYTDELVRSSSLTMFGLERGISSDAIRSVLVKKSKQTNGWICWRVDEKPRTIDFFVARKGKEVLIDTRIAGLAKRVGVAHYSLAYAIKAQNRIEGYTVSKDHCDITKYINAERLNF